MKIKLLTSIAGDKLSLAYGAETSDLSEDDCKRLIAKGQAIELSINNTRKPTKRQAKK